MMNKSKTPAYILRVSGWEQLQFLKGVFGQQKQREIDQRLERYQRHIKQRGFVRRPGYVLLPVRHVKTYLDRGYVYSLETDNQLLVAGTGVVVHNCFPKDLEAFIKISEQLGYDFELLKAVRTINEQQKRSVAMKIQRALWVVKGKTIAVLGLAFKPNTDDLRYAPALDVIDYLQGEGAKIRAFDPQAMTEAARVLPRVTFCKDPYEAARGADCLAILTEWQEFAELDFTRLKKLLKQPLLVDGRNLYDPARLRALGFRYLGIGRGRTESDGR
jgi:UDPglucose 6-dehydrogenase